MNIYKKLNDVLKAAMRSNNSNVKNYIRAIKSKITEYEVSNNLDRNSVPSNEIVIKVVNSHIKSLKKAVSLLEKGGNTTLKTEYENEIEFCETYLPNQIDKNNNIESLVDEAIEKVGKNFGQVMQYVMQDKTLDGSVVKSIVINKIKGCQQ